jgi:hypothetical protein
MALSILPLPPRERVLELLVYDSSSGVFSWRSSRGKVAAGSPAGAINAKGYRCIRIDKILYRANRLAWLVVHGFDPGRLEVDHIDGNRDNNAEKNLRLATTKQNQENRGINKNNTSGYRGVYWSTQKTAWVAELCHNGKSIRLGCFETAEQASIVASAGRAAIFSHDSGRSSDR